MRILITGGRGTIGAILLQYLRCNGHDVRTCDLVHHHDPHHVRCDIADFRQISGLFDKHVFDIVFHLAAEYGRWNGEDYYEQLWRTNVIGTKNMLRLQERLGFKMVFTSTSEVYGDTGEIMSEDLMEKQEIRQLNDYAISKWTNELQILNSAAMHGTQTVRVRIFNTYGPGEYFTPYRSAICRFIYCALSDLPYTVYLDHHRSSIFIGDTVFLLSTIIDRFVPGEVYNIGGTENHDMKKISDLILKHLGKTDRFVTYSAAEPFTTREKRLDLRKTVAAFGFSPAVSLEEGLARTISWMLQVYRDNIETDPLHYIERTS